MDETRKIIIIAVASVMTALYAYTFGYINLTEYYFVFGGLIIPSVGGYTIWNLFIRKAFSLHFQIEEGENLREVGFVRIVPYEMDGQLYKFKGREFLINGRHGVWTDKRNKTHLFFPFNNTFAFHPYAEVYHVESDSDIPKEFVRYIEQERTPQPEDITEEVTGIKKPDAILTKEQASAEKKAHKKIQYPVTTIPIQFFTLMKVDAMEFLNLFAGKLMISRVEEGRKKRDKPDKGFAIMLGVMCLMVGLVLGIFVYPMYAGHTVTANTNPNTVTVTSAIQNNHISTTTSVATTQTIPKGATLIGESSSQSGNVTVTYSTYANMNTTVTISHTTTGYRSP